jgi:hypothetical protein
MHLVIRLGSFAFDSATLAKVSIVEWIVDGMGGQEASGTVEQWWNNGPYQTEHEPRASASPATAEPRSATLCSLFPPRGKGFRVLGVF